MVFLRTKGMSAWDARRPTLLESRRVSSDYPDVVLTPFRPYVDPSSFQEQHDYYICVRPPPQAAEDSADSMTILRKASDRDCSIPQVLR
jgi:hypothetical protein